MQTVRYCTETKNVRLLVVYNVAKQVVKTVLSFSVFTRVCKIAKSDCQLHHVCPSARNN